MISFREVVSFGDSSILPVDGSSHTDVVFRFIVFRPEIGSLLTGKIKSCTREGITSKSLLSYKSRLINFAVSSGKKVTLGFFDDIFIPKDELQHPSRFEEAEQAWVWEYPVEDSEQEKHDLFMDVGETIKFRIIDEEFVESEPTGPPEVSGDITPSSQAVDHNARPPYRIIGAINESGLGVESWWTQNEAAEEEEEEDES